MANEPIEVGGAYVEDENHVPNPTDMVAQYNTEGVGAHQRIEEVSPVFEVDKVKVAEEILGAFDPENTSVSSDRVLLPETVSDNETAKNDLIAKAEARVEQGVVVGGPTPAEREAAEDGTDGEALAVQQEADNATQNSVGGPDAGVHDTTSADAEAKAAADKKAADEAAAKEAADAAAKAEADKAAATKKTAAAPKK